MSSSIRDMVLNEADLDDEEEDESYDEEGGPRREPRSGALEDSSEEEDDDDDEEEAAKVSLATCTHCTCADVITRSARALSSTKTKTRRKATIRMLVNAS